MELEHLFQQSGAFMTLQLIFFSSLLLPGAFGRLHAAARSAASVVVSFGPMALLLYILYQVSRLS